jgi:serine/threonine protein kinase
MYESGTRILDKYVLRERIGAGAFGEVWNADSVSTGEPVAVKMERIHGNPAPTLQYESRVLQLLQGTPGIPRLRYFGCKEDVDGIFMVTELLGSSLETLANSHRLDMTSHVIKNPSPYHADFLSDIGRQMLHRLKSIHDRGMLHRDVKPDNFLFARTPVLDLSRHANSKPNSCVPLLYLIDFGMAKRIDPIIRKEGQAQPGFSLIGSARYASVAAHQGDALGRRDDLISMMYSLIYVANGGVLPWQNHTEREIFYIKSDMTPTELCVDLCTRHADGWSAILERLYAMKVNDAPDYAKFESLL